jgi:hypothetical protein
MPDNDPRAADDVVEREQRLREQEQAAKEHDPAERPPAQRDGSGGEPDKPAPPGNAELPRG